VLPNGGNAVKTYMDFSKAASAAASAGDYPAAVSLYQQAARRLEEFAMGVAETSIEGDVVDGEEFELENDDAREGLLGFVRDARTELGMVQ